MIFLKKGFLGTVVILLILGFTAIRVEAQEEGAQTRQESQVEKEKVYYQAKIDQLLKDREELRLQMENANNTDVYNEEKTKYDQLGEEIEKLKEEYAAKGDKIRQARVALSKAFRLTKSQSTQDYEAAIKHYDEAISLDPADLELCAKACAGKGLVLKKLRRYPEAEEAYRKSIELDPSAPKTYFNLGVLYRELDELDKAIEVYKSALKYDPTLAKANYEIGNTYFVRKDFHNAIKFFREATEVDMNYANAYNALGRSLIELGRYSQAINVLNKVVAIKPKFANAYLHLAEAYNNLGQYQTALQAADNCLKYNKRFTAAHVEAGKAYEGMGDRAKALARYEKVKMDRRYAKWAEWKIEQLKKGS